MGYTNVSMITRPVYVTFFAALTLFPPSPGQTRLIVRNVNLLHLSPTLPTYHQSDLPFLMSALCPLPLLPAEVIPTSKHNKKAKNGEKDDSVSSHDQTAGAPLDLEGRSKQLF